MSDLGSSWSVGLRPDAGRGPQGPPGPAGTAPWTNASDLSADPEAVTDWGLLINTAYAAGVRHFVFQEGDYPFSTQLVFDGDDPVILEGEGGSTVPPGFLGLGHHIPRTRLIWKAAGATAPWSASTGTDLTIRDLGFYYDNTAGNFTGELITGHQSYGLLVERCQLGSVEGTLFTAKAVVGLGDAVNATIRDCGLAGAQYLFLGKESADGFSNANRIYNCILGEASTAQIGNIWDNWEIDGCTFEVGDSPAVIDSTGGVVGSKFTVTNSWLGDVTGATRPMFKQHDDDYWYATFSGNDFQTPAGPMFELLGGGAIHIVDNPFIQQNDEGAVVDLGDISGDPIAKYAFTFKRNGGVTTDADAVLNKAGHNNLDIDGHVGRGVVPLRSTGGHERIRGYDREEVPTVALGAGLSGSAGASVEIHGNDQAGIIRVNSGATPAAGDVATVTFGTPMVPDPSNAGLGDYRVPNVQITSHELPGGFDGGAGAAALPYVKTAAGSAAAATTAQDGFTIATENALASATPVLYAYRVIEL